MDCKVKGYCRVHGEYLVTFKEHSNGARCPECADLKQMNDSSVEKCLEAVFEANSNNERIEEQMMQIMKDTKMSIFSLKGNEDAELHYINTVWRIYNEHEELCLFNLETGEISLNEDIQYSDLVGGTHVDYNGSKTKIDCIIQWEILKKHFKGLQDYEDALTKLKELI